MRSFASCTPCERTSTTVGATAAGKTITGQLIGPTTCPGRTRTLVDPARSSRVMTAPACGTRWGAVAFVTPSTSPSGSATGSVHLEHPNVVSSNSKVHSCRTTRLRYPPLRLPSTSSLSLHAGMSAPNQRQLHFILEVPNRTRYLRWHLPRWRRRRRAVQQTAVHSVFAATITAWDQTCSSAAHRAA